MNRMLVPALLPFALSLGACGGYLGEYQVEDVRWARDIPPDASPTGEALPYSQYIRIELSSTANLNAAETGGGLYTDADECPIRDPNRIIAFGPLASDGKAVESWHRRGNLPREGRDRRYHYLVYVVPTSPARKLFANSSKLTAGYDLRKSSRDLCLRFIAPGYNIVASRSGTVRVPAASIAAARE